MQRPNVEDVRVIRVRLPLPQCYTLDETPRLVAAAETLPGTLGDGMPMADYWFAMIRIAWETGLRLSDLFRVDVGMVHRGILTMRSSKTDTLTAHELTTETLVALVALERLGHRKPTLGWPHDEWLARRHFDAIAERAGVRRGTFRCLRRASGSYVESQSPGYGYRRLGHTTPQVFNKHYDARMIAEPGVLPRPSKL